MLYIKLMFDFEEHFYNKITFTILEEILHIILEKKITRGCLR
jgi:hypothetical protein